MGKTTHIHDLTVFKNIVPRTDIMIHVARMIATQCEYNDKFELCSISIKEHKYWYSVIITTTYKE